MKRIIIIDDDEINNHVCETMIRKLLKEVEVISFLNPLKALDYLIMNQSGFEGLVLIDINMIEITGWELINKMEEANLKIPVMMLTSSISNHDRETASGYTMIQEFLVKPINPAMIMKLGDYLNKPHS